MRAVILAGGKGSRLEPYTSEIPKPLVTIGQRPIIEILLHQMKQCGITRATLAVNHLAEMIKSVLGDGSRLGIALDYSEEERSLSTVGPLKLIDDLPEQFIVANGDILTDLDFGTLMQAHNQSGAEVTVAVHKRVSKIDYGVLESDRSGVVVRFHEKPEYHFTVSMGIYVFSRSILDIVPDNEAYGFDQLMIDMLAAKRKIMTFPFDGYWLDIGRPSDYRKAHDDLAQITRRLNL